MADENESAAEVMDESEIQDDEQRPRHRKDRSGYRQKYKHAWELDTELRSWLTACSTDPFAGFCRFCRCKLHAHKKGLLAHAKSAKHKKHILNPDFDNDNLAPVIDSFNQAVDHNRDIFLNDDFSESEQRGAKRDSKGNRVFNDAWLTEPMFSSWLRKVPTNKTKALCIACRCVISVGRCELIKHTKAAKHQKAIMEGPFEEVSEADLQWLEGSTTANERGRPSNVNSQQMSLNQSVNFKPAMVDVPGMYVDDILKLLTKHIPLELAESWDNVGIITKPTTPIKVYSVLLTIDLNVKIVEEAIKKRAQFIIAYHPLIFTPIKSLSPDRWKDKAILMCIENRITVYTPHTALDAVKGGINDWLISTFVNSDENNKIRPITYSSNKSSTSCLEVLLQEAQETVAEAVKDINNVTMTDYGNASTDVKVTCDDKTLPMVVEKLAQNNFTQVCSRVTKLVPAPIPGIGMGRIVTFASPLPLYEVVQRTKTHLDLSYIRLALSPKHTRDTKVDSIAVCAGSGSSVLKECTADVWITGEMSHHEVLDAINNGTTVILCEHSSTERGFLHDWSQQLKNSVFLEQVYVSVSELDRDPLRIV